MIDAAHIKEHAEVIGSDGQHVGTVDHMEGRDQIKLTREDRDADGEHHYIPLDWVTSADRSKVELNKPAAEAERDWRTAPG